MDGQRQDGQGGVKILFVFYSSSLKNALDQQLWVHLLNNAISSFLYLHPSKLSYQDLCCRHAKGVTLPFPASKMHAVIFVSNWMTPSSSPCMYNLGLGSQS